MSLPELFEKTRQNLDLTEEALAVAAPGSGTTLTFSMEDQEQEQWCWAAVAVSVSLFYDSSSGWIQCDLVNAEFNRSDCCSNGGPTVCNKPWGLDRALTRTNNLNRMAAGAATFQDVNTEIENGSPLGCRIGWPGGAGHFVVLHGYSASIGGSVISVEVADPIYGPSTYAFDNFRTSYRNTGTWTHSYYTVS
jgi:hypothetical protein